MNNLVTIANFVGDRFIPNLSKYETEFNTNYIAPYQKEVLIKLLGFDLYLQFEAGLSVETPEQKWIICVMAQPIKLTASTNKMQG